MANNTVLYLFGADIESLQLMLERLNLKLNDPAKTIQEKEPRFSWPRVVAAKTEPEQDPNTDVKTKQDPNTDVKTKQDPIAVFSKAVSDAYDFAQAFEKGTRQSVPHGLSIVRECFDCEPRDVLQHIIHTPVIFFIFRGGKLFCGNYYSVITIIDDGKLSGRTVISTPSAVAYRRVDKTGGVFTAIAIFLEGKLVHVEIETPSGHVLKSSGCTEAFKRFVTLRYEMAGFVKTITDEQGERVTLMNPDLLQQINNCRA